MQLLANKQVLGVTHGKACCDYSSPCVSSVDIEQSNIQNLHGNLLEAGVNILTRGVALGFLACFGLPSMGTKNTKDFPSMYRAVFLTSYLNCFLTSA